MVVHTDELGIVDERVDGIVVVMALFSEATPADRWLASAQIDEASVRPLVDEETAMHRAMRVEPAGPRRFAVRIRPQRTAVPAYRRETIDEMEEAHRNWETEPGVDPLSRRPDAVVCYRPPGSIDIATYRELWRHAYRWAPVRCDGAEAYVPWSETLLHTVFLPGREGAVRVIQIAGVECDVASFRETEVNAEGEIGSSRTLTATGCSES
jgi:hypothetical protein